MSGGSMSYVHSRLREEASGRLVFPILERLNADYCDLLKSVEWATSGDTSVEDARSDLLAFLGRWGIRHEDWEVEPRSCADCVHLDGDADDSGYLFSCADGRAVDMFGENSDAVSRGTAAGACPFYDDGRHGPRRCMPGPHRDKKEREARP